MARITRTTTNNTSDVANYNTRATSFDPEGRIVFGSGGSGELPRDSQGLLIFDTPFRGPLTGFQGAGDISSQDINRDGVISDSDFLTGIVNDFGGGGFGETTVGIGGGDDGNTATRASLSNSVTEFALSDFAGFALLDTFDNILQQISPFTNLLNNLSGDLYSSRGKIDPETVSPTQLADEAYKSVLNFGDTFTKQFGLLATQHLGQDGFSGNQLTDLISSGVNAVLGNASGGFSFSASSLAGSVLGSFGFGGFGGLFGGLGGATDNVQKAQEQEEKILDEVAKNVVAGMQGTSEIIEKAEGINLVNANTNQVEANVSNVKANVSINEETPLKTVAAQSYVQTSTDHVVTANFYKANHTHATITCDNAFNVFSRHSTRYFTASVVEIAAQRDYISSTLSDYADFRWTQTGQGGVAPIANGLDSLIGGIFSSGGIAIPGVDVSLSTNIKINTARTMNINYGNFYTIDGFVFINSGIGQGVASLPPKRVPNIKDLAPPATTERPEPKGHVSVNDKTYETLYNNNEDLRNFNLGQLITDAVDTAKSRR